MAPAPEQQPSSATEQLFPTTALSLKAQNIRVFACVHTPSFFTRSFSITLTALCCANVQLATAAAWSPNVIKAQPDGKVNAMATEQQNYRSSALNTHGALSAFVVPCR